jgi:F0F1-type ATP synthase membrane subunit b/b'
VTANDAHHIPWKELVVPQIVNFSLFLGLLIYLLRAPLKAHFSGKREAFEEHRKKSEEARVLAERQNAQVRANLDKLENETAQSVEQAKIDATNLKQKIAIEAKEQAARLESEALKMAEFEKSRAVNMLKIELANNAATQAESLLKSKVDTSVQTKLSEDFVGKIQAARA